MSSLSAMIHHYSVVCNGHFFSIEPQKRRAISLSFDFLTEKKYSPFGKKTGDFGLLKNFKFKRSQMSGTLNCGLILKKKEI